MSGQQGLDSLKTGGRSGQCKKGEHLVDAADIGPDFDKTGRQQALDLRSEQEPLAGRTTLPGPVERADAEAVACQNELPAVLIPQGQGKLAPQMLEHARAVILPEVGNHLGVAVGPEVMAPALQLGTQLRIIEQLAVVDHGHAVIFIADRLPAVGQSDNAEPPRCQTEPWLFQVAVFVGTAVDQGIGHGRQQALRQLPSSRQVHNSCDPAHATSFL